MILDVLLFVARLCTAAFAGSCVYIAVAQQPARRSLPPREALQEFRATIPRAERIQPPLTVVSLVAAAATLVVRLDGAVAIAALLMLAVLMETVTRVLPINRQLTAGSVDDHLEEGPALLRRWGSLHTGRTVLAVVAAVLLLL